MQIIPSRTTDPGTSHRAERGVAMRANSQKAKLLAAYASTVHPLIPEEAAIIAEINLRSCYWKRVSELRQEGYLDYVYLGIGPDDEPVYFEKRSSLGEWGRAHRITDEGRRMLKELGQ